MSGSVSQCSNDSTTVFLAAYAYAQSLNLAADGKDIWIFDIDETSLSNLPIFLSIDSGRYLFKLISLLIFIIIDIINFIVMVRITRVNQLMKRNSLSGVGKVNHQH